MATDDNKPVHNTSVSSFRGWLGKKPTAAITAADIAKGLASKDPAVRKMARAAKKALKAAPKMECMGNEPPLPAWTTWGI